MKIAKNTIDKQKKYYKLLLILLIVTILIGIIYGILISKSDKAYVVGEIEKFFDGMKSLENISYSTSFLNTVLAQLLFVFGMWLLGISIIGIPVILFLFLVKGFYLGFSITSMIHAFGLKGILTSFTYLFPHQLIFLVVGLLLTFYATHFSVKLFSYLFLHKNVNFRNVTKKYSKILIISLVISLLGCLLETFLSPILLHFVTKLL